MNNIDIVKILFDSGVKFEEVPFVQGQLIPQSYGNIDNLILDNDKIEIIYKYNWDRFKKGDARGGAYLFAYLIAENFLELANIVLESEYKPYIYHTSGGDDIIFGNSIDDIFTEEDMNKSIEYRKDAWYKYCNTSMGYFNKKLCKDYISYDYSIYKGLENIPNYQPMLELLLKYNGC